MVNTEREAVWQGRVEHWRASGLSQRAFAMREGYPVRQMGYWVRRLRKSPAACGQFVWPRADDACWRVSAEQWRWLVAGVDWQRLSAPAPAKWRL